nr:unnamed protein product [Callosobruchus chinensis]
MRKVSKRVTSEPEEEAPEITQLLADSSSSENSSNEGSGTDSDSDAPLSNWLPSPSTSAAQSGLKGPEIHSDVSSLLTGFLLNIVDKESRAATIASYLALPTAAALRPPEINPGNSGLLRCKRFETGQFFCKHCNVKWPLGVKKILDSCPIDDFLFGKSFPDQLKSSKETQRLGYTIKKQQKVAHFMSPKTDITKKTSQPRVGPSGMPNSLNFRALPVPVSQEKGGGEISLQGSIGSPIGTLPEDPAQTIVSPVKTSYAGRLATYSHTWAKIANDRHVLSWISGYKLLFSNRPVQSYIPNHLLHQMICLKIDNVTAIACINRRGSVRIKSLDNITRRIGLWCENKNIFLVASYINTKSNSSFFPFQHLSSEVAKPFPGGWNFIREAFHRRRVPTVGLQSIQSSLSPSTLKQYTAYLKNGGTFVPQGNISPFQYSLNLILTFLSIQFQNGASYATINSQHAAIVLIFPGIYNQKPSMPKYQATWDPHPVLLHLARLYPLEKISRLQLTMKLVTLLALITGHRLQTLTSIRLQNIVRFPDRLEIRISDRIKTSSSKSLQPFLVIPYFKDNPALCLASVVDYYELVINYELITKDLRPSDIDYLILTVKRPIRQVSSQRLSNWIEQTLAASGIDTTDFTIDPWQTILHFLLKES